jgi:hypothetical protein
MTTPVIFIRSDDNNHDLLCGMYFGYNDIILSLLEEIPGASWNNEHRCWYFTTEPQSLENIIQHFKGAAEINTSH